MGVSALKRSDTGGPFEYAEHVLLTYRKFFTRLWSSRVQPKIVENQPRIQNTKVVQKEVGKNQFFFSRFRKYFFIGVSYGPNFFIAVKNYVGRIF